MPPTLAELHIGDAAEHWSALGFDVVAGRCRLGTIDVTLTGPEAGRGIHGWAWRDTAGPVGVGDVPTASVHTPIPERAGPHPNGAVGLYYVVLFGPSWAEAAAELTALGLDPGQGRPMGSSPGANLRSLADAGDVAVEVIGPVETDPARGWRLWGTIVEVADLDATAAHLGPRLRPIKDAVQPGRRIATLERSAGSSVAIAFMGPDER